MNLWLNIYAKDVEKLTQFYLGLGFTPNPNFQNTKREASFFFNKTILMIFKEGFFEDAFPAKMHTPHQEIHVLFSIDMPSIREAEALVQKAISFGGKDLKVNPKLKNEGFYNTGFVDIEGYHWNILVS